MEQEKHVMKYYYKTLALHSFLLKSSTNLTDSQKFYLCFTQIQLEFRDYIYGLFWIFKPQDE